MYSKSLEITTDVDKTLFFSLKTLFLRVFKEAFYVKLPAKYRLPLTAYGMLEPFLFENFLD